LAVAAVLGSAAGVAALVTRSSGASHRVPVPPTTTLLGQGGDPTSSASTTPVSSTTLADPLARAVGVAAAEEASWVISENARPGTRAWTLAKPADHGQIAGFTSAVSIQAGDPLALYVTTTAPAYRVDAFRMGYYGGAGARQVWSAAGVTGTVQPTCPVTPDTHTVQCRWASPVAVPTSGWVQGDYLFRLTASTGWDSWVPLTVRDDASRSAYLVNNSVTTWEAYNLWGGYDLYQGPSPGGGSGLAYRAAIVSFDRPYTLGHGAGDFVGLELPMVAMMESLGLDVSYTTDVDVSEQPSRLLQHRAFVTLGHDEYYSLSMRRGLVDARDAGVNLVFLGANALYRHIRLEPGPSGPDRLELDYKDPRLDPLLGKDNADVTPWAWRSWPNNAPESSILGGMWQCNPVSADMVVTDPSSWVYSGTGLTYGSRLRGLVAPEYDHFDPSAPNPGNVELLARSPVVCHGRSSEADMTYYGASSGAGVWDTGTIVWVGSLQTFCATCAPPNPVTRITLNILDAFGAGPAGRDHPSTATG